MQVSVIYIYVAYCCFFLCVVYIYSSSSLVYFMCDDVLYMMMIDELPVSKFILYEDQIIHLYPPTHFLDLKEQHG